MSAIPGLGADLGSNDTSGSGETNEIHVPCGSEWRFEVSFKSLMKFKVTKGTGEIFGTELPVNVELQFSGVKYAVYAPLGEGCDIVYYTQNNHNFISGTNDDSEMVEYVSDETPMAQYLNLHLALETERQEVSDNNLLNPAASKMGPRVLIIGNRFSGKTSLAKILSSYALKMDRSPILVNLNPSDGVFSVPGSLTATPISDSFDLESVGGWGGTTTSGSSFHNPKQPLVKNFGFTNINDNLDLYKYQVSKLGVAVMARMEEDIQVKNSGFIVDTPPFTKNDTSIIENIVSDFEINLIAVVGNERLLMELKKRLKNKLNSGQLALAKVPKSGGVVELDDAHIRLVQEETIKEYFNGNHRSPLSPFKIEIDLKDVVIYKGVESSQSLANMSFLPSGDSYTAEISEDGDGDAKDEESLEKFYIQLTEPSSSNLDNSIVAISQLSQKNKSTKDLLNSCVLGFSHISKVDDTKGKLRVLLPFPGAFPRNIVFATNIRYTE